MKTHWVVVLVLVALLVLASAPGCLTTEENQPPRAIFHSTVTSVNVGDIIQFDATNSSDSDGRITTYHWSFGDGEEMLGPTTHHIYGDHGTFNVTLTVTDDEGKKSVFVQTIVVNALPVPIIDVDPETQYVGEVISFNAGRSYDPDGNVAIFMWDFGDGNVSVGRSLDHSYDEVGNFQVTLTVRDNSGAEYWDKTYVQVIYRSFKVNFTKTTGNLQNERNYTLEGDVDNVDIPLEIDNLHMVRFRLSWHDNIKPPGGEPNDMFRLMVTPPDGDPLTTNGTQENLTLLFPLARIPRNQTIDGTDAESVLVEVQEAMGSLLGRGTWHVQVEAMECGGFRDDGGLVPDPGNMWDLSIHYEAFTITLTPTDTA